MDSNQIRARLQRTLHTTITGAEWTFLEDAGLVRDYEVTGDWSELRGGVDDNLSRIRAFHKNKLREQAGEVGVEPRQDGADRQQPPPVPVDLEDRALARSLALDALNNLHSSGSAPPRAAMHGTLLPRGGVDGTVPQFVWVMAAELWVPAEEVAESFRAMQRNLMDKPNQPRSQARAFKVAAFVWRAEAQFGRRPSWPDLCEMWNDLPMTEPFQDSRDFRRYFVRGARATLPKYNATPEAITEQVREASDHGWSVAFDLWVSQVLAATVQRDHGRELHQSTSPLHHPGRNHVQE